MIYLEALAVWTAGGSLFAFAFAQVTYAAIDRRAARHGR